MFSKTHCVLSVLLNLYDYMYLCPCKDLNVFVAVSGSAVSESANRQADRSVQHVTRHVCCSSSVCGGASEMGTDVSVSSAVHQMNTLRLSDELQ